MDIALRLKIHELTDENLRFAKQLGVNHIFIPRLRLGNKGYFEFLDLLRLRKRVEYHGLELVGIEQVAREYEDKILLGEPGRDEQIQNLCQTIRNMGKAGIPVLGYYFSIIGVWGHWRIGESGGGRGGAGLTSYDHELVEAAPLAPAGEVSSEEMWSRLHYFLERVVPVAEDAGVTLAAHPDDPPAPSLRGTARILSSIDGLKRLVETVPSPFSRLEFCQGTIAEMGTDVLEAIRYFGQRKKIAYVHFRTVRGSFPKFDEVFVDEGDVDMLAAIRAYKEVGFDGLLTPDHTPRVVGDTDWGHRGMAFAVGYIRALIQMAECGQCRRAGSKTQGEKLQGSG